MDRLNDQTEEIPEAVVRDRTWKDTAWDVAPYVWAAAKIAAAIYVVCELPDALDRMYNPLNGTPFEELSRR